MSLKLLRWIAVVAPLLFLATVDFVRHFLFPNQLHTWVGFLSTYALIGSAIVLFSLLIFGFIARLQQQIVDQNRRLAALNEIAQATAAEPRLDDLLNTSLDHILGSMRAEAGLVCLIDFEREEHSAVCHRGFSPEVVRRIQRAKLKDDPIAQKVVLTGRSVLWERVLEDSQVAEASRREGIRSGISAPLRSEGAVNGILVVATNQQRQFSRAEQDFLGSIGGQLGMAIQNSILYERARRQADELTALLTVGQTVTSSLDLQRTLETALDQSVTVTGAEAGEIWLAEGERLLSLRAHLGAYSEAFLERRSFLWGEGIPGLVAASGETVVVHDLANDPRFLRQAVMRAGFQTFVALPLWRRNKVTGVLAVAARSPEKLTRASDLRLLEGIAEWVAIAVENAGLHRTVQDTAVVEERERIAREMHDSLGQALGYVNTQLLTLKKLIADNQLHPALDQISDMQRGVQAAYADVREGILALRTSSLAIEEGLVPALRTYCERYGQMSDVSVEFLSPAHGQKVVLEPPVQLQLLRIVQEALTNVRKHAHAGSVVLALDIAEGSLTATVRDDGCGFDPAELRSTGWPRFGLQTMRERAEAVGGLFRLESKPGGGTTVTVQVPLAKEGT